MESNVELIEQIRELVAPLSVEERLTVIRTIAAIEPTVDTAPPSLVERRQSLATEQETWYALPLEERQTYQGEFVAVHDGQVVDHDPDQRDLYIRVRSHFGHIPVLIVHADWKEPPVYQIHSPQLEQ